MMDESSSGQASHQAPTLWLGNDESWELTWPIWHMLPRDERKALALQYGFQTIGEFEEFMTLQRAVGDSAEAAPYESALVYQNQFVTHEDEKVAARVEDDGYATSTDEKLDDEMDSEQVATLDRMPADELIALGGMILILPEEILHKIFDWLPVDAYATLAHVSPHWKSFTRTEKVYKRICERLYLNQSKRRVLHVSRFGNSYRNMLERRPRVRTGGGVYTLKYAQVKPIQRDMWTEIPAGAVLEIVYYRYLYFLENGRVLYALTTSPPHEMFRRFRKVLLSRCDDEAIVWGTYQVQKCQVVVTARQPWQYVRLELTIQHNNLHGRYGILSFDGHTTTSSGNFDDKWSVDRVIYGVPDEPFRFMRDKRL